MADIRAIAGKPGKNSETHQAHYPHFTFLHLNSYRLSLINITLPGYLLTRIDEYVLHHPEEKSRSGFLASAALKVLQQG